MQPILRYLLKRLLAIPITLFILTAVIYGIIMLTPPGIRAVEYMPSNLPNFYTPADTRKLIDLQIQRYHLDAPFPVQYASWLVSLVRGDWGYSGKLHEDILPALIERTPATAELTFYAFLLFLPLGLWSGVFSGYKPGRLADTGFRLTAFIASSLPPFIFALILLAIFYVGLDWFPPGRIGLAAGFDVNSASFHLYTGFLTIDGLLNGRPDISLDAARHLVLPVITLALAQWAILGRITRAALVDEMRKDYINAARARGLSERQIAWGHAFKNTINPAMTSTALSAAAMMTMVFVVEIIFNIHGISDLAISGINIVPDAQAALGFTVYSVLIVLILMLLLDLLQMVFDPRIRIQRIGGAEA